MPNAGFMTGLAFSKQAPSVLYAELVSFAPEVQPGVYRVDENGGAAELFMSLESARSTGAGGAEDACSKAGFALPTRPDGSF